MSFVNTIIVAMLIATKVSMIAIFLGLIIFSFQKIL